jgi:hypothetical protein
MTERCARRNEQRFLVDRDIAGCDIEKSDSNEHAALDTSVFSLHLRTRSMRADQICIRPHSLNRRINVRRTGVHEVSTHVVESTDLP